MKKDFDNLADIQNLPDDRAIPLKRVGIKNINYPIVVLDREKVRQHTIATINMFVNLPQQFKGTHMSRFVEILNEYRSEINVRTFFNILSTMKKRLEAQEAHLEIEFPYFLEKSAPVTGTRGLVEYGCGLYGTFDEKLKMSIMAKVPVTTVCPCSKEISDYGAHTQRGMVKVICEFNEFIWLEDIIEIVEQNSSSPVFSVLKRPDEKYVTERGYEHPLFVEDLVRDIYQDLKKIPEITSFSVEAENFESIHNHSAYAYTSWRR